MTLATSSRHRHRTGNRSHFAPSSSASSAASTWSALHALAAPRAESQQGGSRLDQQFHHVTGAIIASLLFNVLVQASRLTGVAPEVSVEDNVSWEPFRRSSSTSTAPSERVVIHRDIDDVAPRDRNGD